MNKAQKTLYDLQDLDDKITAQTTAELLRLQKERKDKVAELRSHLTTHYTKRGNHTTLCAGPDCDVKAVARYRTSKDWNGLVTLALEAGVDPEKIDELITKAPQWAIG